MRFKHDNVGYYPSNSYKSYIPFPKQNEVRFAFAGDSTTLGFNGDFGDTARSFNQIQY